MKNRAVCQALDSATRSQGPGFGPAGSDELAEVLRLTLYYNRLSFLSLPKETGPCTTPKGPTFAPLNGSIRIRAENKMRGGFIGCGFLPVSDSGDELGVCHV